MGQFTVHKNKNAQSKARYPLLLDVQSQLLDTLGTRLVVPLAPASHFKEKVLTTLTPLLEVDRKSYLMLTPQMAGISSKELGAEVADLSNRRNEIMAAIDFLITGI
jgi:toxin CcdB